jgi:hypothetical protein
LFVGLVITIYTKFYLILLIFMLSRRRSPRTMDANIYNLAGLSPAEVTILNSEGVTNGMMLAVLGYDGIGELLSEATIVVKRKLEKIGLFVAKGFEVDGTTTMADVMISLNNTPAVTPIARSSATRANGSVKVSVNFLSDFSGAPIDWEEWEETTVATVRQTHFASVLENAPEDGNVE